MYTLKATIQKYLKAEVRRCNSGVLLVQAEGRDTDLQGLLKTRFSEIQSSDFRCFEKAESPQSLVVWKDWYQPALVEYQVVLSKSGVKDTLLGSWIK